MKDFAAICTLAFIVGIGWVAVKIAGVVGGFLLAIIGVAWLIWNVYQEQKNAP